MKNSIVIVLILAGVLLIASKPTDKECINQVRQSVGAGSLAEQLLAVVGINKFTINVEDHLFFKSLYTSDGARIGTGICGHVFLSQ